jgi:protein TonB
VKASKSHPAITRISSIVIGIAIGVGGCGDGPPIRPPTAIPGDSLPFEYPLALWDTGIEGEVEVMVHVTEEGAVDSAFVAETSGQPALDSAAVLGAHELRFTPGRQGDRRVATWVRVPVRFRKPGQEREGAE